MLRRFLISAITLVPSTLAYSDRAGQCLPGQASVGIEHLLHAYQNGTLADFGFEVMLDGNVLNPTIPFSIEAEKDYSIVVNGPKEGLRGVLIRVQADDGIDTTAAILPDGITTQIAISCETPVIGISHFNSTIKPSAGGALRLDMQTGLVLDITVVTVHDHTLGSEFCYSGFAGKVVPADSLSGLETGATGSGAIANTAFASLAIVAVYFGLA